jgi:hypothetical protein
MRDEFASCSYLVLDLEGGGSTFLRNVGDTGLQCNTLQKTEGHSCHDTAVGEVKAAEIYILMSSPVHDGGY